MEEQLFNSYVHCREAFEKEIFNHQEAIDKLIDIYTNILANNKSVAKMCRGFNNNEFGNNKRLAKKLNHDLPKALEGSNVATDLQQLGLARSVYETIYFHLRDETSVDVHLASTLWSTMSEISEIFVHSALMAAQEIAHKYNVFGVNLDDLVQEANIGLYTSVDMYDPNYRTPDGKKTKWLTYAYGKAEAKVKEWIMVQSREIRLPHSKLELIFTLIEASKNINTEEEQSEEILTREVNRLLRAKGKPAMSIENVHDTLILFHGNTIHMDKVAAGFSDDAQRPRTLGELLEDPNRNAEERYLYKEDAERLDKILRENLDEREYHVITIRYLERDKPVPCREVADIMHAKGITKMNKPLTRQRIEQLESTARNKLKEIPALRKMLDTEAFKLKENT